jgi:hypothetical protein
MLVQGKNHIYSGNHTRSPNTLCGHTEACFNVKIRVGTAPTFFSLYSPQTHLTRIPALEHIYKITDKIIVLYVLICNISDGKRKK